MSSSGLNNLQLSIYCSVEEHDEARRRELLEQLRRYGIKPEFHGDKIEFRYRGGRKTVLELVEYAYSYTAHYISLTSRAK